MKRYHIETKKKSYNAVDSSSSFRKTRKICKDTSSVICAQRWNRKAQAWVPAGKKQFAYKGRK